MRSGLADAGQTRRIADTLVADALPPCGTPYMISLELLALHRAGRDADAERLLRAALRKTGDEAEAMIEFYDFDRTTPIRLLKRRNAAGVDAL